MKTHGHAKARCDLNIYIVVEFKALDRFLISRDFENTSFATSELAILNRYGRGAEIRWIKDVAFLVIAIPIAVTVAACLSVLWTEQWPNAPN